MNTLLIVKLLRSNTPEDFRIATSMLKTEADWVEFFWIEIILFRVIDEYSLSETFDVLSEKYESIRSNIVAILEREGYDFLPDSYYDDIFKEIKNGYSPNS